MDPNEIKRKINDRIDRDRDFADKLGDALEAGLWQTVANLLARAFGWVLSKAGEIATWLISNW